ncbi:cytochrome b [Luteimonas vadosa]|uniref:Cytochrome b n=1 Tax=Luteimonas vadosa TaxID=1165507 RepID=A0ABP9DUT8_9GAMM
MQLKNTRERWGIVSQALHWLIVLLILGQGTVGLWMEDLRNGPDKLQVYALHKSFGLTILALAVLRLLWRWYAGRPEPVPGIPRWQVSIARLSHWLLYALLLAIPLSGWLLNSAAGFPLQWFGLFDLPAIAAQDNALHELAEEIHEFLFWTLVSVAALHAAAAFHHHLFRRDATLVRMLPGSWSHGGPPQPPAGSRRDDR